MAVHKRLPNRTEPSLVVHNIFDDSHEPRVFFHEFSCSQKKNVLAAVRGERVGAGLENHDPPQPFFANEEGTKKYRKIKHHCNCVPKRACGHRRDRGRSAR